MIIKNKIVERVVTVQSLLKKADTNSSKTSEAVFRISKQPTNTCPMIDKAKAEIQGVADDYKEAYKAIRSETNYMRPTDDECDCGNTYKDLNDRINLLNSIANDFDSNESFLLKMNDTLEKLRSSCETHRAYGDEVKDLLWELISEVEAEQELPDSTLTHYKQQLEKIKEIEWIDYDKELGSYKAMLNDYKKDDSHNHCSERCSNSIISNQINEVYDNIALDDSFDYDEAIENYRMITSWADELRDLLNTYIKNIELLKEDILANLDEDLYIKELNNKIKLDFIGYFSAKFKAKKLYLEPVDKDEVEGFFKELKSKTESHAVIKQMEDYLVQINESVKVINSEISVIIISLNAIDPNWAENMSPVYITSGFSFESNFERINQEYLKLTDKRHEVKNATLSVQLIRFNVFNTNLKERIKGLLSISDSLFTKK